MDNLLDHIRNRVYQLLQEKSQFESITPKTQVELVCDELFQQDITKCLNELAETGGVITENENKTAVETKIEKPVTAFTIPFLATVNIKIDPEVSGYILKLKGV